jgi:hypothetical protein
MICLPFELAATCGVGESVCLGVTATEALFRVSGSYSTLMRTNRWSATNESSDSLSATVFSKSAPGGRSSALDPHLSQSIEPLFVPQGRGYKVIVVEAVEFERDLIAADVVADALFVNVECLNRVDAAQYLLHRLDDILHVEEPMLDLLLILEERLLQVAPVVVEREEVVFVYVVRTDLHVS